ncbi:Predicted metal-dependent hydrolase, TIM-barrel fold [Marinactinospora thermotolerans DSM 45154]|uniref:Predicted metal-dependent hydrolase, TIM-barrel fold n=1 Tax=Marinactinospora thermotolerans DSM 45154 TaxID=1122192 RepID=A0A1T4RR23_9ACTN|nr:amidohydrolase family protein [Marinactinospora thermotolerans]SKA18440.1 Predicted metal-dependent hydrolase, TIM-barrel fold [Marinactinospora thermotolerans DSM 45154]
MFDAHLHIIDPKSPPWPGDDEDPPRPFTVADYRSRVAALGVVGGAVVAGSSHPRARAGLVNALRELGGGFVGVAMLEPDTPDSELRDLHSAGVRALRLDLRRRGAVDVDGLVQLALRAADLLGWPAELRVDSRELGGLSTHLAPLRRISVDHLGLAEEGLPALFDLVASGARVKATGFGRGDLDVPAVVRTIAGINPSALMFGTDLPSTGAAWPFVDSDVSLLTAALTEHEAECALSRNAVDFYGVDSLG